MEDVIGPFRSLVHHKGWPSTLIAKIGEFDEGF